MTAPHWEVSVITPLCALFAWSRTNPQSGAGLAPGPSHTREHGWALGTVWAAGNGRRASWPGGAGLRELCENIWFRKPAWYRAGQPIHTVRPAAWATGRGWGQGWLGTQEASSGEPALGLEFRGGVLEVGGNEAVPQLRKDGTGTWWTRLGHDPEV